MISAHVGRWLSGHSDMTLSHSSAMVTTVDSVGAALAHIVREPQDMLLSDVVMPREGSYDLQRRRARNAAKGVPRS